MLIAFAVLGSIGAGSQNAEPRWLVRALPGRAPVIGYQEAVRFGHSANDLRWDDRDDRDMIMRFADRNYAFVTFKMRMDGDYYVAFDGVWNPTGSRLLD